MQHKTRGSKCEIVDGADVADLHCTSSLNVVLQ